MSSSFLERFRSRMQQMTKDGKFQINDSLKISTKIHSNQCHQDYREIGQPTLSPKVVYSLSPVNMPRHYSNIPRFLTPKKFNKNDKLEKNFEETGQIRIEKSWKVKNKLLPGIRNYNVRTPNRFTELQLKRTKKIISLYSFF